MAKSKRQLGAQPEANPLDNFDLDKLIQSNPNLQKAIAAIDSDPSLEYRGAYHAPLEVPEPPKTFLPIDSQGNQGSPLGLKQNEMLVLPEPVTAPVLPIRAHAPVEPDNTSPSEPERGVIPWFENLQLKRQGVPDNKIEQYKILRDEMYGRFGRSTFAEDQLKHLQRQFEPRREVTWEIPVHDPANRAIMPIGRKGVARNYDPETGDRVPMNLPEGAIITGHKDFGDNDPLSPRVKAELVRQKMNAAGGAYIAPLIDSTKKKGSGVVDAVQEAMTTFGGLVSNGWEAPANLVMRGLNKTGITHIPDKKLDDDWNQITGNMNRGWKAWSNPETPAEKIFSAGMDSMIAVATIGTGNAIAAGIKGTETAAQAARFLARGAAYAQAFGSMKHAVKNVAYDPLVRGKMTFTPDEAHKYLEDTYHVYTRHMADEDVQKLAYAMNKTARDAAFDIDPFGMGKQNVHLQAVAYGLDNFARMAGQEPSTDRNEQIDTITKLGPKLFEMNDKATGKDRNFPKDVNDLLAFAAQGQAKRQSLPNGAQWTEGVTTSLAYMADFLAERKLFGSPEEMDFMKGIKRIVRDSQVAVRATGARGAAVKDIFSVLGSGAKSATEATMRSFAGALATQNIAIAREGGYLYDKLRARGMNPGAAFMNSYFTSTMTRTLDRFTEEGIMPMVHVGNAMTKSLVRRVGNAAVRSAIMGLSETGEEQAKDMMMYGIEETTGKPADMREQPFRPLSLGGFSEDALHQAAGEALVSFAIGGIMGIGGKALHPIATVRQGVQALQQSGYLMGDVDKGLQAQGWTNEKIKATDPITRMTEYYGNRHGLGASEREILHKTLEMNIARKGASGLAEMLHANVDGFMRSFGTRENFDAIYAEYQQQKAAKNQPWILRKGDLAEAVAAVQKHEKDNPVGPTTVEDVSSPDVPTVEPISTETPAQTGQTDAPVAQDERTTAEGTSTPPAETNAATGTGEAKSGTYSSPRITVGTDPNGFANSNAQAQRDLADRLGITADIERLAADGLTASQIRVALKDKIAGVAREDQPGLIIGARATLGIPSRADEDGKKEFDVWLKEYQARRGTPNEASMPVMTPQEAHDILTAPAAAQSSDVATAEGMLSAEEATARAANTTSVEDSPFDLLDAEGNPLPDIKNTEPPPPDMTPDEFSYQKSARTEGMPVQGAPVQPGPVEQRIRDNEADALKLRERMQKNFPWVQFDTIEGEAQNGQQVLGKSARDAFWVGVDWSLGRLDTVPHEYAHQFVSWFRNHDLVKNGLAKYGSEEALVDAIGKHAVERQDDGFIVAWAKDFWGLVKQVFGHGADEARMLAKELYKGEALTRQTPFERVAHGTVKVFPNEKALGYQHLSNFLAGKDIEKMMFQMEAKHGTAFKFDQFENDKIGVGEGAQVYGHGLYFTKGGKTSTRYAEVEAKRKQKLGFALGLADHDVDLTDWHPSDILAFGLMRPGDSVLPVRSNPEWGLPENDWTFIITRNPDGSTTVEDGTFDMQDSHAYTISPEETRRHLAMGEKLMDMFASDEGGKGYTYNVELWPERDHTVINWDGKIKDHADVVEKARSQAMKEGVAFPSAEQIDQWHGETFYRHFTTALKSQKAASEFLYRAGIDGIEYNGQRDNEGNFVVFNADDVRIRYRTTDHSDKDPNDYHEYSYQVVGTMSEEDRAIVTAREQGRVMLPTTGQYTAKDQAKSDEANKFIGRGSARSSTSKYAQAWGDRANTGQYVAHDRVMISAEGNRAGRVGPDFAEISQAIKAGATLITDAPADRERPYNTGEREVAAFLARNGYTESRPGEWTPAFRETPTATSVYETLREAEQVSINEGRDPSPEQRQEARRTGDTTVFEGSLAEHSNPVIGLQTMIKSETGLDVTLPVTPADLMNLLEMPSRTVARDELVRLSGHDTPEMRDVVTRFVARASNRTDFPKVDINIAITTDAKTKAKTADITLDVHQSSITRDPESGRITDVQFGTYVNEKGSPRVTWEDEPLLVKMADVPGFIKDFGLTVVSGMNSVISRISGIRTAAEESMQINELGQLATQSPDLYRDAITKLAAKGIVLLGPPGKNQSFIALNVVPTITPRVFDAYIQTLKNYVAWMDEHKPEWRQTASARQYEQMMQRIQKGYAGGRPDITALNRSMTMYDKMLAVRAAFLSHAMGPEWATSGTKVFKYMNTLATSEQQTIPEFLTAGLEAAQAARKDGERTAAEKYAATLPPAQAAIYREALADLRAVQQPNVSDEDLAGNVKDTWNLAARLKKMGYEHTRAGIAYRRDGEGRIIPGSERHIVALVDHDTYKNGTAYGDGSSLIQPGASIIVDRGHGDPQGDVKFHKVRLFRPSLAGKQSPLLWKGLFDVARGEVLYAMRETGVAMMVFDSTVKVGKKSLAKVNENGKYTSMSEFLKMSDAERIKGTDMFLLSPSEMSKANDATSRSDVSTSMVGQLLFANASSPVINPGWEGFYQTMRQMLASTARRSHAFLSEIHTNEPLLRAIYENLDEEGAPGDPAVALRTLLREDEGGTPALTMLPHWRPATNSMGIRTALDALFDHQGSMRVIGQNMFLRADNGSVDGVNIQAIGQVGGVEAVRKYCNVDDIIPVKEFLTGASETVDEVAREFWKRDKHEEYKADKAAKILGESEGEFSAYKQQARDYIARKRGLRTVEIGGTKYWMRGDGRLKAEVDGATPVVVSANKAEKMGWKVGDKVMAVAIPTDAPHNGVAAVIVGVSNGTNDWISYSPETVIKLGKDHDGDKLSVYGASEGHWQREVDRLKAKRSSTDDFMRSVFGKDAEDERSRELALTEAKARHGFMELSQADFDAMWKHYADPSVKNFVSDLYKNAGIKGAFDPAAVAFIKRHVTAFGFTEPSDAEKKQFMARHGVEWTQPRPYSIFSPLGDANLMEDYVGQTADLISYVASTRNKIEYVVQNLDRIYREQAEKYGRTVESYYEALRTNKTSDGFTPLERIAMVGAILTNHAADAPKEDAIFDYHFDAHAYFDWALKVLGVDLVPEKKDQTNFTKELMNQYGRIREAMIGVVRGSNVYLNDQTSEGVQAIPEARMTTLQAAAINGHRLGTESLMDALSTGWGVLPDLSVDADTFTRDIAPDLARGLAQSAGFESVTGPVDRNGRPTLLTSDASTRELNAEEQSSMLGTLRDAVRRGDKSARNVAYALIMAQAFSEFSGRASEANDRSVEIYKEMFDVMTHANPLRMVLPRFVTNLQNQLFRMKVQELDAGRYIVSRTDGIIRKSDGVRLSPKTVSEALSPQNAAGEKRTSSDLRRNATELWDMAKKVTAAFSDHTEFTPSVLTGMDSLRMTREYMDKVLKDPQGNDVRGVYEDIARVMLNSPDQIRMQFSAFGAKNRDLGAFDLKLSQVTTGFSYNDRKTEGAVNPAPFTEQKYTDIAARKPLNLAGVTYLTPDMREAWLDALRQSKGAATAVNRVMPVDAEEEIDLAKLTLETEDEQQRLHQAIERRRTFLQPKISAYNDALKKRNVPSAMLREMGKETRENFAKYVRDLTRLAERNPDLIPPEWLTNAVNVNRIIAEDSASFDYQLEHPDEQTAERIRTHRGFWRTAGDIIARIGTQLTKLAPSMTSLAEFSVGGKLGVLQPTRIFKGTDRIGPNISFRVVMPDREQAPFIFRNEVEFLSTLTSHGIMNDPVNGEVMGAVDLAHAYVRFLGEKVTTDERAIGDALERITRIWNEMRGSNPQEWARIGRMLTEELHSGTRFPMRLVQTANPNGGVMWAWRAPDGTLLDSSTDTLQPSQLRGLVEQHFSAVIDEIAGKDGSGAARADALAQAAHLLRMTMQLRKFIAQNNYQLFAQSRAIKAYQMTLPGTSKRDAKALQKAIDRDNLLLGRIAKGEFYYPAVYKAPSFLDTNGIKTQQEESFVELYVNTVSARASKDYPKDALAQIHLQAVKDFLGKRLLPDEQQRFDHQLSTFVEGAELPFAKRKMAEYLRGTELPLGVSDPKGNMNMISGGVGLTGYDPHTMQRMVDIGLLMDPKNAGKITLDRPATEYLSEDVSKVIGQMMNEHLGAMLNSAIHAVQSEHIDPIRNDPAYRKVTQNWDRWSQGVFHQKNFTQKVSLSQLIKGEDIMLDVMQTIEKGEGQVSFRPTTVRLKFMGRQSSPGRGTESVFGATVNGKPAEIIISNATGDVWLNGKQQNWETQDMRTWVRDQGRVMEALARRGDSWAWTYLKVAPYWKFLWNVAASLGGFSKLGFNPTSAVNNMLYQVKTTLWNVGAPQFANIDRLLKSNDPWLKRETEKVLYALPVFNWEFIAAKVAEGTVYKENSLKMMLRSVQIRNEAMTKAIAEANTRGLEGLSREVFVHERVFDEWTGKMMLEGSVGARAWAAARHAGTSVKEFGKNLPQAVGSLKHVGDREVRKEMYNEVMNLGYKMFAVTEQMNRAITTTTAWMATTGWQSQSYTIGTPDERTVDGKKYLVSPSGLKFGDLPAALRQRILHTQGVYARMMDEACNYDYANVMRPAWLRQPLANLAYKFGVFTMASYVHRSREMSRLVKNRDVVRTSQGKVIHRPKKTIDRQIAFDPSMVTAAEWADIIAKIAPMATSEEQIADVKANISTYLAEHGVLLHDSQLDPVWRATKFVMFNLIDQFTKHAIGYQFLVAEPLSVFFWSALNLMSTLTGFGDDDDKERVLKGDPMVQAVEAQQIRSWINDISRNSPIPGGLMVSQLFSTALKYAVLSKYDGGANYAAEYTKDEMNLIRDPGFRQFSNMLASWIPAIKQGADLAGLVAGQEGGFGEPTTLGEWAGRMIDAGDRDILGKKLATTKEQTLSAIHQKGMNDKTGWNVYKQNARANILKMKAAVGSNDDKIFRSGIASKGLSNLVMSDDEQTLAPTDAEMLWLERNRLGEDKADEKLVKYYANRLKKEALKKGIPDDGDLDSFDAKAEAQATRRIAEWNKRMGQLKIGTGLKGAETVDTYLSRQ